MQKITPKEMVPHVVRCINHGLVPFIQGSPGCGKSDMVKSIAKKNNLKVIDLRLSQCSPEDLQGYPMRVGNKAEYVPFNTFPIEGDTIPEGYAGYLLFLDEFNGAPKSVQLAAYRLVLDRQVGQHNLHEKVAIVCAGNLTTDKAVTVALSTAMQSRLIHFEMEPDKEDWVNWAIEHGIDSRIISFIQYQPAKLYAFNPNHTDKTFACPRTWEFASRLIKDQVITDTDITLLAGTISYGVACEFVKFAEIYQDLPRVEDIVNAPDTFKVPSDMAIKFAAVGHLVEHTTPDNIEKIATYIKRFGPEFEIIYFRMLVQKNPTFQKHTVVSTRITELVRFMHD